MNFMRSGRFVPSVNFMIPRVPVNPERIFVDPFSAMRTVMFLVLFDLFDKSCSKYGSREGKNANTNDNSNTTHQFSQEGYRVHIAISHGGKRDQCPPHCGRDAGIEFRLCFMFCVIHDGTYQYQCDEKEGQSDEQFFFFPCDDTPKRSYGFRIPPELQDP